LLPMYWHVALFKSRVPVVQHVQSVNKKHNKPLKPIVALRATPA
jgi:hypothetical protein